MFCPTCGADSQKAKAFCKRCGEWLPDIKAKARGSFGGETPQQNIFTGLFMSALSTLAALFSAIALYATYLGGDDAKWSIYVAAAFCLCIAGWQASSFVVGLKLSRRLKRNRGEPAPVCEFKDQEFKDQQAAPGLNAGDMTSVVGTPGVTEVTTRELEPRRWPGSDKQR